MPIARHVIVEECFTQQNDLIHFFVFSIYPLFVYPLLLPPELARSDVALDSQRNKPEKAIAAVRDGGL